MKFILLKNSGKSNQICHSKDFPKNFSKTMQFLRNFEKYFPKHGHPGSLAKKTSYRGGGKVCDTMLVKNIDFSYHAF